MGLFTHPSPTLCVRKIRADVGRALEQPNLKISPAPPRRKGASADDSPPCSLLVGLAGVWIPRGLTAREPRSRSVSRRIAGGHPEHRRHWSKSRCLRTPANLFSEAANQVLDLPAVPGALRESAVITLFARAPLAFSGRGGACLALPATSQMIRWCRLLASGVESGPTSMLQPESVCSGLSVDLQSIVRGRRLERCRRSTEVRLAAGRPSIIFVPVAMGRRSAVPAGDRAIHSAWAQASTSCQGH